MFGIGFTELLILGLIIAILIGPNQLPHVMRVLAKIVKEITKAKDQFEEHIDADQTLRTLRNSVSQGKRSVNEKVESMKSRVEDELKRDL